MASVIWPKGNKWGFKQVKKLLYGCKIFEKNTKVIDQTGDAIIIAKGNIYENITAEE